MCFVWITASFGHYLISYQLKYIRGNIFINGIVSSVSECAGYLLAGILFKKVGLKATLTLSYSITLTGILCLLLTSTTNQFWLSIFILGAKFGISISFNIAFIGTYHLFPPSIIGTAFGICGVFGRVSTIFAPYVAELKPE